jgi:hypothetical protein
VKDYDAFIRALDEQHKREIPGGATALENEWMRQHLVTTILEGSRPAEDEAATAEAPAASPVGEPEQPERSLPSPPTEIVAEGGVSRWPGAKGVKIDHVELLNRSEPTSQLHTGERLDVRLTIRHEVSRRFVCRYSVLIFTKDARAVSRFHSPAHEFQASEGAAHVVTLRLDPLLLSNGEYLVTVGIYGAGPLDQVAEAERYDNLSLSFKFRVVDPIRTEWSIFHHPCRWELPRLGEGTSEWHDVPHGAP